MKIFLDIDGVMVPAKGWLKQDILEDGFPPFSKKAVQALQMLLTPQAEVILTTSHRFNFTADQWIQIFSNRNIQLSQIDILPACSNAKSRKDEIMNWFEHDYKGESYLIIDDDSSVDDLPNQLKKRLIKPSPHIGLTEELINLILQSTL